MTRRNTTAALLIAAAAGLALLAPAAAQPAAYSDCPANRFCLWDQPGGTGRHFFMEWGATDLARVGFDNTASSWKNNTGDVWCLYPDPQYRGTPARLGRGQNNMSPAWNNVVSSVKPC